MFTNITSALTANKAASATFISQQDSNKRQKLGEKNLNLKFKSKQGKQYEEIKTKHPDYQTLAVQRGELQMKAPSGNELLMRGEEGKI